MSPMEGSTFTNIGKKNEKTKQHTSHNMLLIVDTYERMLRILRKKFVREQKWDENAWTIAVVSPRDWESETGTLP